MSFRDPIDTTGYDFERWMRFAFDRPVSGEPWYFKDEMHFECDPLRVIGYYTRLFQNSRPLLAPYTGEQVEQGLWFVVGNQLNDWLWDEEIPLPLRLECVGAMPAMFRDFLIDHELDTACFMWWDMLRYFGEVSDPQIVDAMARALDEVLQLPARHCQMSALHGLGHLTHDSKEGTIRRFLEAHLDIDDEMRAYAEQAIAGSVL